MDGGGRSRQGAMAQQPTIDRSIRGTVTLAEAPGIVKAEARVLPPPFSTAVVVKRGNSGMEPTAMAALLTAEAVDGGGGNGIDATAINNNN